jgi:5-hydroxyisourate hydrolase
MSPITTHVLDTNIGKPAVGVRVVLERRSAAGQWQPVGRGVTDDNGRLETLLPDGSSIESGQYRLDFDTRNYFASQGVVELYPRVTVIFQADANQHHYHLPLLLGPFGYTTYRGS